MVTLKHGLNCRRSRAMALKSNGADPYQHLSDDTTRSMAVPTLMEKTRRHLCTTDGVMAVPGAPQASDEEWLAFDTGPA